MKTRGFLIALTAANLATLTWSVAHPRAAAASPVAPVLRGRALEIVDDRGQVRASISVLPADPNYKMPDGTLGSPETVLLRLLNGKGQPNVKIESTGSGAAMGLVGESEPANALLVARGTNASLTLVDRDRHQQTIKP